MIKQRPVSQRHLLEAGRNYMLSASFNPQHSFLMFAAIISWQYLKYHYLEMGVCVSFLNVIFQVLRPVVLEYFVERLGFSVNSVIKRKTQSYSPKQCAAIGTLRNLDKNKTNNLCCKQHKKINYGLTSGSVHRCPCNNISKIACPSNRPLKLISPIKLSFIVIVRELNYRFDIKAYLFKS